MKKRKTVSAAAWCCLSCCVLIVTAATGSANPFMIDTTLTLGETPLWQCHSDIAFDGTNFLVVWQDIRQDGFSRIMGCRVTPNGEVLDNSGFIISISDYYALCPRVAYDGSNYVVAWYNEEHFWPYTYSIKAARVTPAGTVLDSTALDVSPALSPDCVVDLSIGTSGSNSLIAWAIRRESSNKGVFAARISTQGVLLDSVPIPLVVDPHLPKHPTVAFDGNNYLIAWEDCWWLPGDSISYWIDGSRISENGTLIDTIPRRFVTHTFPCFTYPLHMKLNPSVAMGANNYLLTWNTSVMFWGTTQDILGTRITPEGNIIDTSFIPISTIIGNQNHPSVAFDGSEFLVAWMDFRLGTKENIPLIFFTKVDTSGNVLNPAGNILVFEVQLRHPSLCYGNGIYMASFRDRRGKPFRYAFDDDIFVARVNAAGSTLDPYGISTSRSTASQRMPAIATDGENHLIVWEDERDEDMNIYGALTDSSGALVVAPFPIETRSNAQVCPVVDFVEPYYLVAWIDYRDGFNQPAYRFRRVRKDGTLTGPHSTLIFQNQCNYPMSHIALSNDNVNFLALYTVLSYNQFCKTGIVRIDTSGTVIDTNALEIDSTWNADAAFDGTNWTLCYYKAGYWGVHCAQISREGVIVTPSFAISAAPGVSEPYPSITFNGANYLVCWCSLDMDSGQLVYGSRVSPAGYDLDSVDIRISKRDIVAFDLRTESFDSDYLAIWTQANWDNYYHTCDHTSQIYATFIAPEGTVLDTLGIELTPPLFECKSPDVALSSNGEYYMVYSRFTDYPYGSYRIYGQFVEPLAGTKEKHRDGRFVDLLERNYPNPFSEVTLICYQLSCNAPVELSIYDASGRMVRRLVNEEKRPGIHSVYWDGKDDSGRTVSNGVYFYKLTANGFSETRKMVVVR